MPFCPNCGNEMPLNSDCCPRCNQRFKIEKLPSRQENYSFSDFIRELESSFPDRIIDRSRWDHQRWDGYVTGYCKKYNCTPKDFFTAFNFTVKSNSIARVDENEKLSKIECPKCGRMTPSAGKYCGYCGKRTNNHRRAQSSDDEMQPPQKTKESRKTIWNTAILPVISIVVTVICILYATDMFDSDRVSDSDIIGLAESLVSQNLKNPYLAIFNSKKIVDKDSYGRYIVELDYSAQNSFGGYVRDVSYVCIFDVHQEHGEVTCTYNKYYFIWGQSCRSLRIQITGVSLLSSL